MVNKREQQEILYNLVKIIESFPQYTVAQHLVHFLRTKGDKEPYHWDDKHLLSKVEYYYNELLNELQ